LTFYFNWWFLVSLKKEKIMNLNWKLSNRPLADIGFGITKKLQELIVENKLLDIFDLFPFRNSWDLVGHVNDDWLIIRISDRLGPGMPTIGKLKDQDLRSIINKIEPFRSRSYLEVFNLLGNDWFSADKFTYVGIQKNLQISFSDITTFLLDWLNHLVISEVYNKNESRIMRAVPKAPQYDIKKIYDSIWILESEESFSQGTAFYLNGTGFITCQHVLGKNTMAFHPSNVTKKYPVTVLAENETIDLAMIKIDDINVAGLFSVSADNINQTEHICIAGYPNYRLGDTGTITPGVITGFRVVSSIRRMLTNAPIIAGCSGGPVINAFNKVVGVAVTGADCMEKAQTTDNHGIIPIDALSLLM
jgi:hypothetical protein